MPRLNYGTLLENIVVLEATRLSLDQIGGEDRLALASAFAMPPLTQCWCRPAEEPNRYTGGPNGALLAAMLAAQRRRAIRLWVNDDAGRYGWPC